MPATLEEITLSFVRERVRFDRHGQDKGPCMAILECVAVNGEAPAEPESQPPVAESRRHRPANSVAFFDDPNLITVKAETEPNELVYGLAYRFYGRWLKHPRYGRQFAAKTFVRAQPHGRKGTITYLCQAPWIGRQTAIRLWDRFGGDAVRICRESPEVASAAGGSQFNLDRATEAAAWMENESRLEAVTIDMIDLLAGRGFPKGTGKAAVAEWGNRAAGLVHHNPYLLMRFRGCGFLRTDAMYLDLGGDPARLKRQALCAWHAIASDSNGHTWFQPQVVERGLRERIGGAKLRVVDALWLAKRAGLLAVHREPGERTPWLADSRKAGNEAAVAERVSEWLAAAGQWPSIDGLDTSDHQRERLADALAGPLGIFTGGPGTGKTYCAARAIAELIRLHGAGQVAVCAPTGKAAVRITEAMTGYGIDLRARTIHSLLKVASRTEGDGWGFEHGADNPLPFRFVVVDEASMIDTDLMAALMRACGAGTHLLLVGDTGQLPPVGHGAPLRDLIAAGVPCGELSEIRRNSGQVVIACHQIRAGERFHTNPVIRPEVGHNLKLLAASGADGALRKIIDTIHKIDENGLGNPVWDCQVIVAVNAKSGLSRKAVNERLQGELNPTGVKVPGNPFRVGDKIVCLKNGWYPAVEDAPPTFNAEKNEDGQVYAANGEQAEVKLVESNFTIAQLDAPPRLVLIPRAGDDEGEQAEKEAEESAGTGCRWDLAYAISCHKAQGAEFSFCFIVLDEYPGARRVCSREWLYTAISRAKVACLLVGKLSTAHGMIPREAIKRRKTFLAEQIRKES
uniref:Putative ATPase domain containing protein n=1 Tax=viral metagenome TaxID=1070528 RepID=A0A6M3KWK6_9ZZZZ